MWNNNKSSDNDLENLCSVMQIITKLIMIMDDACFNITEITMGTATVNDDVSIRGMIIIIR